jgi:hypothetical protein
MLRHLGLIAACACIVASVGCDGGNVIVPTPQPPPPPPVATVTAEFGGRVVNADAGGPIGNVRVSVENVSLRGTDPAGWSTPTDAATSGGDGTFTLPLDLPVAWRLVSLRLTAPPGYDDRYQSFEPTNAADRPAIRMYPTLVIRPGESIDVRVDTNNTVCRVRDDFFPLPGVVNCRRVLVAASPGDPVELEVVADDSTEPMALSLEAPFYESDMSVRRLLVPPGGFPYVIGDGTARLTARR